MGYAFGCVPFPSAGVGAPHIRDRAYWVAQSDCERGRGGARIAGQAGGVADAEYHEQWEGRRPRSEDSAGDESRSESCGRGMAGARPGPTNGHWMAADWLFCRDGQWRPVEPGTFPLAHGAPARVGRLRGFGNSIVAQAAHAFIEAYLEQARKR
jgi:DNA (cytosine-5)-methyltransferase 1